MDFGSLLSGEISKKRKQAQESSSKKAKFSTSGPEVVKDPLADATKDDTQDATDNCSRNLGKQLEELIDKDIAYLKSKAKKEDDFKSKEEDDSSGSPEEVELLNSITETQLDAKLKQLNEFNPSDSKLTKIKKLQILMQTEDRKQKYREVIERESELYSKPELKIIGLDLIADIESNKQRIHTLLRVALKDILTEWEIDVEGQDPDEDSLELLQETKKDMIKLLYKLRSFKLNIDMLTSLATIVHYIQENEYRRANESYMKLSIGNVAWPIGVQDVGIHARSADTKITGLTKSSNILIDDKTRRWITAVKRLITYKEKGNNERQILKETTKSK